MIRKASVRAIRLARHLISRDINELGISKSIEGFYVIDPTLAIKRKKESLTVLLASSNAQSHYPVSFFCVKCDEGYERLIAACILETISIEVIGTFSENGMVFVITPGDGESSAARKLAAEIRGLLEERQ